MRSVFRNSDLNQQILDKGFVVMDLLGPDTCDRLVSAYHQLHATEPEIFFTTTHSPDTDYRKACDKLISGVLFPEVGPVFENYVPLYGNFMVKPSGLQSECNLHQDWSFVDEAKFRSVNVWVAMEDIDLKNGCIHVVPGSHNLPFPARGRNISRVFEEAVGPMMEHLLLPVPLKKGQCVIFDSALLHYSPPNMSGKTRLAVSLMLYPQEARLVHYVYDKEDPSHLTRFNVDREFFTAYSSAADLFMTNDESMRIDLDKITYETIRAKLLQGS